MAQIRDEHRKPVIRAFVALPGETLVGVTVKSLPGSGLSVLLILNNRDERYMTDINQSSEGKTKNITFGLVFGWLFGIVVGVPAIFILFKEANSNKHSWFILLIYGLWVSLFVWQIYSVINPIIHGLCVYK